MKQTVIGWKSSLLKEISANQILLYSVRTGYYMPISVCCPMEVLEQQMKSYSLTFILTTEENVYDRAFLQYSTTKQSANTSHNRDRIDK